MKSLSELTTVDIAEVPVWEYVSDSGGPVCVEPVEGLPVTDLRNRVVGTKVTLQNGDLFWAILGNIDIGNKQSTCHFITISIENGAKWFDLARYHDVDYLRRGPEQLARFLELPVTSIFPIRYDLSEVVSGDRAVVKGSIPLEPREKLSQDKLIQLALE